MSKPTRRMDINTRFTILARRIAGHYYIVLLISSRSRRLHSLSPFRLRFNSDLADLLPANHPDLKILRRIQARYATDTVSWCSSAGATRLPSTNSVRSTCTTGGFGFAPPPGDRLQCRLLASRRSNVFAAGDGGRVHRFAVSAGTCRPSPTTATIRGRGGDTPNRMFAVGDRGTILRFDGRSWTALPSPTTRHLRGISGHKEHVIVVGDGGTILRWQKDRFQAEPSPSQADCLGCLPSGWTMQWPLDGNQGPFLCPERSVAGGWCPLGHHAASLHAGWGAKPTDVPRAWWRRWPSHLRFDGKQVRRQRSTTGAT